MRKISLAMLFLPAIAICQDYPVAHASFVFHPIGWIEGPLTDAQVKNLGECRELAQAQAGQSDKLASLYGQKKGSMDLYGSILAGCLADERNGKGWVVLRLDGDKAEKVTSRYAVRTFMGLNPAK